MALFAGGPLVYLAAGQDRKAEVMHTCMRKAGWEYDRSAAGLLY
jgi:hypothetical protein